MVLVCFLKDLLKFVRGISKFIEQTLCNNSKKICFFLAYIYIIPTKEVCTSKSLLVGTFGNSMMRCDCRNEQLCKTAELQKAPSAQSSSKILELAKGKE